jgi:acetolactate synthase I/III small subunit
VDQAPSGADVYIADSSPKSGPWTVRNMLDPVFDKHESEGFKAHTVLIEVEDIPGVLNEVTGVIARRGYNIQSLAVGNSEAIGRSRITTVLPGQVGGVSKLIKQLEKLVVVQDVTDVTEVPHVARELMLVKVSHCRARRQIERRNVSLFSSTLHNSACCKAIVSSGRLRHQPPVLAANVYLSCTAC